MHMYVAVDAEQVTWQAAILWLPGRLQVCHDG